MTNHSPAPVLLAIDLFVTVPDAPLSVAVVVLLGVRVIVEEGPVSPKGAISFTVSPWKPVENRNATSKEVSKCWPEEDVKVIFSLLSISPPTTNPVPPTPTPVAEGLPPVL